ncbi:glycosyltransferase [Sulfurimonas sediminis]|uniref:Glycosyltransferase n=1 Tax=Sulfurimonas sediminis TaxID=2590020 RepID=A0A7M1B1X2_9BACT|nr:rhamnan synthesis F family protein [Sulfurimonas sediminis]QOP42662.1 glycosyltransferase [Sulfurimonas sediminis]
MFKTKKQKEFEKYKKIIEESRLFDNRYYLRAYGDVRRASETPIDHFIKIGLKEDRKPNAEFDPVWYKHYYKDIQTNNEFPFIHYIVHGQKEFRFSNPANIQEYEALKATFDANTYKNSYEDLQNLSDDFDFLWHYLHYGQKEGRACPVKEETANTKEIEIKTVTQVSSDELSEEQKYEYHIIHTENIDFSEYFTLNQHPFVSEDPILDYIINWKKYDPVIANYFDTSFYFIAYPDVQSVGINPLVHYISAGKVEGRKGVFDNSKIQQGSLKHDATKETVVFVSHESSASGAPLLGYNIVNILKQKYNIVHIVLEKKNIHDAFLNICEEMLVDIKDNVWMQSYIYLKQLLKKRTIKCIIANSVVTNDLTSVAKELSIPSVLLVHEFSDYIKPKGTMANSVLLADKVIVPAKIIRNSIQDEFVTLFNSKTVPANIFIQPQGKLPFIPQGHGKNETADAILKKLHVTQKETTKIIVGSGWVQPRKGVDLFIATAKYIKQHYDASCKFVWVGDGFDPEVDLAYSVWLQKEIEHSRLDDDFIFLQHQKNLDTIFSIADVFCLTSRMDPFPNVVIDALEHNLHIACFKDASGSVEFLEEHKASCTVVDYIDTYAMAAELIQYFQSNTPKTDINKKLVKEHLDFDQYVSYIDNLMNEAIVFEKNVDAITNYLLQNNLFDLSYYDHTAGNIEKACHIYVSASLKGIRMKNPKPGFNDLLWIENYAENNPYIVPVFEAHKQGILKTHTSHQLPIEKTTKINFFYAVHLHLYYIDLAQEFASYFKNLPGKFDILLSVVKEEDIQKAEDVFGHCGANSVKVMLVENIGRDSGPLYFGFKEVILSNKYEVIGHFHTKKSLDVNDGIGDKWREYLLNTLVGDKDIAHSIMSLFSLNKKLGLVFPDDPHVVDIGENKEYVDKLCEMLQIESLNDTPLFPVGNMFWARTESIKQLFSLNPDDVLEEEPLPYDGSYMHAIERITPTLVNSNGFEYNTVYRKGIVW